MNQIEDFSIVECSQNNRQDKETSSFEANQQQQHRTIDERIINNYYVEEYMSLENVKDLKQNSLKIGLRSYRFRSLAWSIFLNCLPEKPADRIEKIRSLRNEYQEIKNKFRYDPRTLISDENIDDNPLSQEKSSYWNRYFSDHELQTRIKQDVVRAFPDINFFQTEKIQCIMVDILFNFARENSHIEYKQGMHELLAPILFVIHSDHESYLFARENGLVDKEIQELMDPTFLEHDSYFLFLEIMKRTESWYDTNSINFSRKNEYVNFEPFSQDINFHCYSSIGLKLKKITEQILRNYDEKLYHHLKELKIAPQIYGIRWLRLLFIREFQMQDLLVLWDAIFADDFSLCDYIFTSMLVVIRNMLLTYDYADCLNHLMRYPSVCDVHYVIHLALHIRDPLKYREPVGHSTLVLPNPKAIKAQETYRESIDELKTKKLMSNVSSNINTINTGNNNESSKTLSEMKSISFEWLEDKFGRFHQGSNQSSNQQIDGIQQQQNELDALAKELEALQYKTDFCAHYMTIHLEILQKFINFQFNINENHNSNSVNFNHYSNIIKNASNNDLDNDNDYDLDRALISIAELKKIRDILRGTIVL